MSIMKNKAPFARYILYATAAVILLFFLLAEEPGEGKTEELFFTVLHTNEEHSALLPHSLAAHSEA